MAKLLILPAADLICLQRVHAPSVQAKLNPLFPANAPAARGRRKFLGLPAVGDERIEFLTKGSGKADRRLRRQSPAGLAKAIPPSLLQWLFWGSCHADFYKLHCLTQC